MKSLLVAAALAAVAVSLPGPALSRELGIFFHFRADNGREEKVGYHPTLLLPDLDMATCRDGVRHLPRSFVQQIKRDVPRVAGMQYVKTTCEFLDSQ